MRYDNELDNFASSASTLTWERSSFAVGQTDPSEIFLADTGNFADQHDPYGNGTHMRCYQALDTGSFATGQRHFGRF